MPQSKDEDELVLRELHAKISALHSKLHTIQILTVDPDNSTLSDTANETPSLNWLLLSSRSSEFKSAVGDFTQHKRCAGEPKRTLAFDDCRAPLGEWQNWSETPPCPAIATSPLEFSTERFGEALAQEREDLEARLGAWRKSLAHEFAEGGTSLWLTIRHRLLGFEEKVRSAIYLVFEGEVAKEIKGDIAHLAREFLFDRVLRFYERQIEKRHENIEDAVRAYLAGDPLVASSTARDVSRLKPLLAASIPVLIEGERGTGKLNLAMRLLRARQEVKDFTPRRSNRPAALIVNCVHLAGDHDDVVTWFRDKGILTESGELCENLNRDIVFDDIQLGSRVAQHVIYRLINARLGWDGAAPPPRNGRRDLPLVILTVGPSIETAIQQGSVVPELGLLGAFKISLPTLHDRLGQVAVEQRFGEFSEIVSYLGKRAQNMMPNRPSFEVSEDQLQRWMNLPWRENYWGLKQNILQHVINSKFREPDA